MNTSTNHWLGQFTKGLLLIFLGLLSLSLPTLTSYTLNIILGWLFAVGGVMIMVDAMATKREGSLFLPMLLGMLLLLCGLFMLIKPLAGILTLSTLLTTYLLAQGICTLLLWWAVRAHKGAGWIAINGLVTLLLAILILSQWPIGGLVFIGIVIGIHLMMWGLADILFSLARRA
jgi:uncharacterized membrane protein HdeD (DUF308 family)